MRHLRMVWLAFCALAALAIAAVSLLSLLAGSAQAVPAFSAMGLNGKPASLRLLNEPCANEKVLAHLRELVRPQFIGLFRASVLVWDARRWASCWVEIDGTVYSMDEEGSAFQPVPRSMFREDSI